MHQLAARVKGIDPIFAQSDHSLGDCEEIGCKQVVVDCFDCMPASYSRLIKQDSITVADSPTGSRWTRLDAKLPTKWDTFSIECGEDPLNCEARV